MHLGPYTSRKTGPLICENRHLKLKKYYSGLWEQTRWIIHPIQKLLIYIYVLMSFLIKGCKRSLQAADKCPQGHVDVAKWITNIIVFWLKWCNHIFRSITRNITCVIFTLWEPRSQSWKCFKKCSVYPKTEEFIAIRYCPYFVYIAADYSERIHYSFNSYSELHSKLMYIEHMQLPLFNISVAALLPLLPVKMSILCFWDARISFNSHFSWLKNKATTPWGP